MVKYVYDAWGYNEVRNPDGSVLADLSHIGNLNPFRYRGYYYDTETKLYFLKTRYYDPEIGRFITIDDISYLDPETTNGLNLYAYCGNNPVMAVDPEGTKLKWWQKVLAGIGIVIATALTVVAIVASAGTVAALAGVGAAALGFSASTVATIATVATIGTYVVAAGVGAFGLSDAIEVWSGGLNPIRDWVMGGNQTAYNITHGVFDTLGTVAIIAGAIGPKIIQEVAKSGIPKVSNGNVVGYSKDFFDRFGNWNFRIDATTHGNSSAAPWHYNPHIHLLERDIRQGGIAKAVKYFWQIIKGWFL